MRSILMTIFIAFTIISCNSNYQNKNITIADFTKTYCDTLRKNFPNAKFEIINDSTIESSYQQNDIRISADNAYSEYQFEPDSLNVVLTKYISSVKEL
jgi:hypothetical protein